MRGAASFPRNNCYLRYAPTSGQLEAHTIGLQISKIAACGARAGHAYKGSVPEITVNVPEITVGRIKTNWWRPLLERPIQPISAT